MAQALNQDTHFKDEKTEALQGWRWGSERLAQLEALSRELCPCPRHIWDSTSNIPPARDKAGARPGWGALRVLPGAARAVEGGRGTERRKQGNRLRHHFDVQPMKLFKL